MSRQIFHRYLLCCLFVSAILICGSSRRIPRRALCSSCGKDYPETLASPWYPEESNLQIGIPKGFIVSPLKNSLYSRLTQGTSQDITRSDVLSRQNSRCPYVPALPSTRLADQLRQQTSLPAKFPDRVTKILIEPRNPPQTILAKGYPLIRQVLSTRQFVEPKRQNVFFRSPRDKYSMPLSEIEDFKDGAEHEEDSVNKLSSTYRKGEKPSWEDIKRVSLMEILPWKSSASFRPANIYNKKDAVEEESASPVGQRFNPAFSKKEYSPGFDRVSREPYVPPWHSDIQKSTKNEKFDLQNFIINPFDKISNYERSKLTPINAVDTYPVKEEKKIATEDNDKLVDYDPYNASRNSYIWQSAMNRESSNQNSMIQELQELTKAGGFKAVEDHWPKLYPVIEKGYYAIEEDEDQESFEDMTKDIVETQKSIYNPYAVVANTKIWTPKQKNEELFDDSDVTMEGSQEEAQKSEVYPVLRSDGENFQDEPSERNIQDEVRGVAESIFRESFIDITPSFLRQIYLGILNAAENSTVKHTKRENLPEMKSQVLLENSEDERNERLREDKIVLQSAASTQDKIFPKDTFDVKKHNDHVDDTDSKEKDLKDNMQIKASIVLDPDLISDIEHPPLESTKATPCILS